MLHLPPLNALKSFESAARTGSYVAAAAELKVTPAAVSQQVRHLESFLRRKLFTRLNNRIVLTDAGQAVYAGITPALEEIAALTARVVSGTSRTTLVVSVLPSLAECWFVPAIAGFLKNETSIKIDLRVEEDPVDFAAREIDLRLCYGTNLYPDLSTVPLFRDHVVPMCAPELAAGADLSRLDDGLLIHTNWGHAFASLPRWAEWFQRHMPGRAVDERKGHRAGSSSLALDFARRGLGVALGQRQLAEEDIAQGRLVILSPAALLLGHDYSAVYPQAKSRRPGLHQLMAYLQTRVPHR